MTGRPRPLPSSSSSRASTQASERPEISWSEFIRAAAGTGPPERSESADRKRRHTSTSPERRHHPRRAAWIGRPAPNMSAAYPGSSRDNAVDLTSPPQRPRYRVLPEQNEGAEIRASTRPSILPTTGSARGSFSGRPGSEIILPPWQPDTEVHRCPVCHAEFTFWFRKHHCRKCGRVVCHNCSPHRITIPRQYIVQPVGFSAGEDPRASLLASPLHAPGGGEEVRVCNPCVPDPWTPEPAPDEHPRPGMDDGGRTAGNDNRRVLNLYQPVPPPPPFRERRVRQPGHPPTDLSRSLPYGPSTPNWPFQTPFQRPPPPPLPSNSSHPPGHRHSQSSSSVARPPPLFHNPTRTASTPSPSVPPQPRPRRQVREEDECPVCGSELPPGDDIREAHIQECIAARFSSPPSNLPSAGPPPPRSSSIQPSTSPATTTTTASGVSDPSRPRATSYRPRGMAIYRATEKDCMDEEGEAQECVICFEEFQPGDEMGRMECLCKFHRACIRRWWETKGVGSCPTHMLHE